MRSFVSIIIALIATLCGGAAHAQSPVGSPCPYIAYGSVLTAAQWQYCFEIKADATTGGYLPLAGGTMTGPLVTAPSATGGAGFNLAAGTAPTSPNNGDMWSTSAGFYGQAGGVTYGPFTEGTAGSFAATAPLAVTFPSSVVTYALAYNSSLTKDGSNNLGINLANTNVYSILQTIDLGTGTAPAASSGAGFDLYGANGASARSEITAFTNGTSGVSAIFDGRTSLGTRASPSAVTSGTLLSSFEGKGYDTSVWTGTGGSVHVYAEGTFSPTSHPGEACLATTASGATATTDWLCVHNDGGATLGSPTGGDEGAGTLNLAGALYGNGTAPTGTGGYVRATSPTLVTPALGMPTNLTLTNATGLPIAGISGFGTGVAAALANAVNTTGGPVTWPSSGGGTTNFLRADGTWATPSGGGGTPCTTTASSLQYDASGSFGCASNWSSDGTDLLSAAGAILKATTNFEINVGGTNKLDYGVTQVGDWTSSAIFQITSNSPNALNLTNNAGGIGFRAGTTVLTSPAAATLQYGPADSVSPGAQTLRAQSGSGSNIAGQNLTLIGSLGTGNAASGNMIFEVGGAVAGSGTTAATATTAMTIVGGTAQPQVSFAATTASTSTTTGGAIFAGGIGVAGGSTFGGTITAASLGTGTQVSCLGLTSANAIVPATGACGSGSGGSPGGSNTQVQYNNSSAFGGISGVTSNGTAMTFATGDLIINGGSATAGIATVTSGGVVSSSSALPSGTTATTQSNGDASTKVATTAFVQQSEPGGYVNKFRNGTFDVWQRGTSALATSTSAPGSYTADGWQVQQTTAAGTCAQDAGTNGALYSLKCVGASSNADTIFGQPIEASIATPLAGNTATIQFQFKQDTGSSVTPKISTCYASATNNFATCTSDLSPAPLTACASGTWCTESYTLSVSASASQGYRVNIDCNTALSASQHCWITAADIRVTPGVATGLNSNPPPPELRPVGMELAFCYRYFWAWYGTGYSRLSFGYADTTTTVQGIVALPTAMRVTPTATSNTLNAPPGSSASVSTINGQTANLLSLMFNTSGLSVGSFYQITAGNSGTSNLLLTAEL